MVFSRKTFLIALLIPAGFCEVSAVHADSYRYMPERNSYSKGEGHTLLDEATARRLLTGVADVDLKQVWFATGRGSYHNTPTCIVSAGVWAYTKPALSSPGLWRGRLSYIEVSPDDPDKPTCEKLHGQRVLSVPVASFIDPNKVHLEEARDGYVPGVFHVDSESSDPKLLELADAISKIHGCLKSNDPCPYHLDESVLSRPRYLLTPAFTVENLLQIDPSRPDEHGVQYFEMIFSSGSALRPDQPLDIIYKDSVVVDVKVDVEIVE